MCLAVPGQVVEVEGMYARVVIAGHERRVAVAFVPDLAPGDWVFVHAGYALQKVDEDEARRTLEVLRELAEMAGEEREPADRAKGKAKGRAAEGGA